ncbi:MAG: ABC transporter ATP-binding protein [Phycisphaeraceae bacterium]|nr:ABC transporter ATP-binding protein [Phycisphaerales bacterium]MCB9859957.1 ABC transporter ATP-binding protein [Phycisphaeraceae bacterium]
MPELRLNALTRVFRSRETPALDGVSFVAPDGKCTAVLGPSGCGKTTLLRIIAGLEKQTSGLFVFNPTDHTGHHSDPEQPSSVRSLPHTYRVAMVFQTPALYKHLTGKKNILIGAKHARNGQPDIETLARSLDISHILEARPAHMSVGERQRVALAKALASKPDLLLLDEPLSSLDPHRKRAAIQLVRTLRDGVGQQLKLPTTLLVTHDQHEAAQLAHHMIVMRNGRVQQEGVPAHIFSQPATLFVARFVGEPPMNVLVGRVGNESGHMVFSCDRAGTDPIALDLPTIKDVAAQPVVLCVRPNRIDITPLESGQLCAVVQSAAHLGDQIELCCKLLDIPGQTIPDRLLDDVIQPADLGTWTVCLNPGVDVPALGSRVGLGFKAEDGHLFSLTNPEQPRLDCATGM